MATIQERTSNNGKVTYRVFIRLKGYPMQTATFRRKTDARRWVQVTEAAIREGRHFKTTEAKKHTLGELIDRYIREVLPRKPKSQKKQTAQLQWWKGELGAFTLADVTPAMIAQKRDELVSGITCRGRQRASATVVRYLSALSHAFSIAVREWGWLDDSPMRKVTKLKEPRGRDRFLSKEELDRLLQACKSSSNPYLYPMVLLLVSTGMRFGEAASLTWSSVSLQQKRIILKETKNGEVRAVPLSNQVVQMLTELEKKRRIDTLLVFPPRISAKVQKVQKRIDIRHSWLKALKTAAIEGFRIHDLRHTAASYLTMSGASLTEVAHILGHKSLSQVKRYSHLSETHKSHVIQKMNEILLSSGGE